MKFKIFFLKNSTGVSSFISCQESSGVAGTMVKFASQSEHALRSQLLWNQFCNRESANTTHIFQARGVSGFLAAETRMFFFFLFFPFLFSILRERGRERERKEKKHPCIVASHTPPTGDLAHNPGKFPDWESNQWLFGSQAGTESIEPHQPGLKKFFY